MTYLIIYAVLAVLNFIGVTIYDGIAGKHEPFYNYESPLMVLLYSVIWPLFWLYLLIHTIIEEW